MSDVVTWLSLAAIGVLITVINVLIVAYATRLLRRNERLVRERDDEANRIEDR